MGQQGSKNDFKKKNNLKPTPPPILPQKTFQTSKTQNPIDEITILDGHQQYGVRKLQRVGANRIASTSDDNKVIIWDTDTGKKIFELIGHEHPVTCMISVPIQLISSENAQMASLETSSLSSSSFSNSFSSFFAQSPPSSPPSSFSSYIFPEINQGYYLITGSNDKTIRVWDVQTGELIYILEGHTSTVTSLILLKNNKLLCSGGNLDSKMIVWNIMKGKTKRIIKREEEGSLNCIISLEDHNLIITASDSLIAYRDFDYAQHLEHLHRESIKCLSLLNKNEFASGSLDGTVVIWSALTLQKIKILFVNDKNDIGDHHHHHLNLTSSFPFKVQKIVPLTRNFFAVARGCGFKVFKNESGEKLIENIIDIENAHENEITNIIPLYGYNMFVTSSSDNSIRLWGLFIPPVFRFPLPVRRGRENNNINIGVQSLPRFNIQKPIFSSVEIPLSRYHDYLDLSISDLSPHSNNNINNNINDNINDNDNNLNNNRDNINNINNDNNNDNNDNSNINNDNNNININNKINNDNNINDKINININNVNNNLNINNDENDVNKYYYYSELSENEENDSTNLFDSFSITQNNNKNNLINNKDKNDIKNEIKNDKNNNKNNSNSKNNNNNNNKFVSKSSSNIEKIEIKNNKNNLINNKNDINNRYKNNNLNIHNNNLNNNLNNNNKKKQRRKLLSDGPKLITCFGEMNLHSASISDLIKISDFGFASCSYDGLVILWKDGRIQTEIRNNLSSKMELLRKEERELNTNNDNKDAEDDNEDYDDFSLDSITILHDYDPDRDHRLATMSDRVFTRKSSIMWNPSFSGQIV